MNEPNPLFPGFKTPPNEGTQHRRQPVHFMPAPDPDAYDIEDDPNWYDTCNSMGVLNCYCGGDLCVCDNNGGLDCPDCQ